MYLCSNMQNYKDLSKRKVLPFQLPDCRCKKCGKLALPNQPAESLQFCGSNKTGNKQAQNNASKECATSLTEDRPHKSPADRKDKLFTFPSLSTAAFRFAPPQDFSSVLFDLVGIVSFFIMISIMFWLAVSQYLWSFAKKLLQAGRNIKLLTLALFLVLGVSITFHVLSGTHHRKHCTYLTEETTGNDSNPPTPPKTLQCIPKKCQHKKCLLNNSRKSNNHSLNQQIESYDNGKSLERKHPSLCDLCAAKSKQEQNLPNSILSDEEIREMYKRYKLYSVPSEMKFPPSFGHVFEVLLGLFDGLSDAVNRTFF